MKDFIVYSVEDATASEIMEQVYKKIEFKLRETTHNYEYLTGEIADVVKINGPATNAQFLNSFDAARRFMFVSKHASAKGILCFTSHALGNWSNANALGGEPKELGIASPLYMIKFLSLVGGNKSDLPVTYEATHHGPLLNKPALFVEIGPIETAIGEVIANFFADAIIGTLGSMDFEFDKVAFGIGGVHYSEKFSKLALTGKYIFSHIMPKYYANEYDMLEKALKNSELNTDVAVIDWKSIKAEYRDNIIKKLNALGVDYEKA